MTRSKDFSLPNPYSTYTQVYTKVIWNIGGKLKYDILADFAQTLIPVDMKICQPILNRIG